MTATDRTTLQRILVHVDFAEATDEQVAAGETLTVGTHHVDVAPASHRALQLAATIARGAGPDARLCLLHATPALDVSTMYTGPTGITLPAKVVRELHARAEATSSGVLEVLAARYADGVTTEHVARSGRALDVILQEADRFGLEADGDVAAVALCLGRLYRGSPRTSSCARHRPRPPRPRPRFSGGRWRSCRAPRLPAPSAGASRPGSSR